MNKKGLLVLGILVSLGSLLIIVISLYQLISGNDLTGNAIQDKGIKLLYNDLFIYGLVFLASGFFTYTRYKKTK